MRGIGKKTLEFTVKSSDFKVINSADHGLHGVKCDGLGGTWNLNYGGQIPGTTTFTLTSDGGSGAAGGGLTAPKITGTRHFHIARGTSRTESMIRGPCRRTHASDAGGR